MLHKYISFYYVQNDSTTSKCQIRLKESAAAFYYKNLTIGDTVFNIFFERIKLNGFCVRTIH